MANLLLVVDKVCPGLSQSDEMGFVDGKCLSRKEVFWFKNTKHKTQNLYNELMVEREFNSADTQWTRKTIELHVRVLIKYRG